MAQFTQLNERMECAKAKVNKSDWMVVNTLGIERKIKRTERAGLLMERARFMMAIE